MPLHQNNPYPHPPKDNILHNSKTTCSSRLCHFSASQLEWSFLLCCLLLKPQAWLAGSRPTRLDDLDSVAATRERKPAWDVNVMFRLSAEVHISKGREMMRLASLRAHRHDGFILKCNEWTCRPACCSQTTSPERFQQKKNPRRNRIQSAITCYNSNNY